MSGPEQNPQQSAGTGPDRIAWGPRILGPLALAAAVIALLVVISTSGGDGNGGSPDVATKQAKEKKSGSGAVNPKNYVVESGDTLSGIAAKFDVSTKRLLRLNPGIDPQALATGTELKIR